MKEKLKDHMNGKICLVTGATDGIGKATAQALAQMDAPVVIVGRNPAKCAAVVSKLKYISGNNAVEALIADLSIMAEARQLAEQFTTKYQKLHVLVNNVGAAVRLCQDAEHGWTFHEKSQYCGSRWRLIGSGERTSRMFCSNFARFQVLFRRHIATRVDFSDR